jgi:acyl transferase domain-containing protein
LHLQDVNPEIPLEALGLAPQQSCTPWPKKVGPLLAGVTAISMSGVNAHMVLEGPPRDAAHHPQTAQTGHALPHLLLLSARCSEALSSLAKSFWEFLTDEESGARLPLRDICYTASVRRTHHGHRLAIVCESRQELVESLEATVRKSLPVGVYSSQAMLDDQDIRPEVSDAVAQCLHHHEQAGEVVPSPPRREDERATVLEALGVLFAQGHEIDWGAVYPDGGQCVQLPTYPWQRERLWLDWLGHQESSSRPASETQLAEKLSAEPGELVRRLEEAPQSKRRVLLLAHVRDQVARVLGLGPAQPLELQQGLFDAGLDSLAVVELTTHLQVSLGRPLPATLVFDYPTIKALADYIAREVLSWDSLGASHTETQESSRIDDETTVTKLEQLSEEEAEALLLERLKAIEDE